MKHCRVPASGFGASAGLRGFDFAHDSDTCSSDALKSRADCLNLRCDPSVSSHLRLPNLAPHTWQFASVVDRYYYLYAAPKCACPWQRPKTDSSGATHSWTCMPESQECRIPAAAHLKTCCCTLVRTHVWHYRTKRNCHIPHNPRNLCWAGTQSSDDTRSICMHRMPG